MMKKKFKKIVATVVCLTMAAAMTGCGASKEAEKVTVTFMNGEETLGSAEAEAGQVLDAAAYASYENAEDADFLGWYGTPTYLEASLMDLTTATFTEDTTLYGYFQSDDMAEDTRAWYVVGTSAAGPLALTNWAADVDDATKEQFQLVATGNAVNEFAVTIDLYEGDQFQIIHDWNWDGQKGFGYVKEYDESQIANGGGLSGNDNTSNINVTVDGNYTITLTTNPDDEAQDAITIVRNGDAAEAEEAPAEEAAYEVKDNTGVRVKGSWVEDWSELKDLEKVSDGVYEITMEIAAGTELYFSIYEGDTDTELGLKAENVVDDASKALLEDAYNVKVAEDGTYTFTVDLTENTITITK